MAPPSLLPTLPRRHLSAVRRRAGSATLGLVAATALAVCTSVAAGASGHPGSKSPAQITAAALAAGRSAKSVTIKGTVSNAGQTTTLNLKELGNGNGAGSITFEGQTVQVVKVGHVTYLKGSPSFWKQVGGDATAGQLLGNRWVKSGATGSDSLTSSFGEFLSIKSVLSQLGSSEGKLTKAGTASVHGHKAYLIKSSKGGILYVAATGKPYPLELKGDGGSSTGAITFSNWNKHLTITAPSGAIDIDKLGSGSGSGS